MQTGYLDTIIKIELVIVLAHRNSGPSSVCEFRGSTIEKEEDTLFTPIDMAWDWDARSGHITIPEVAEGSFEPIKNPVTGAPHYAMIRLYSGFEFRDAEMASATAKGTGAIQFDFAGRYAFLIDVTYGPQGIIEA